MKDSCSCKMSEYVNQSDRAADIAMQKEVSQGLSHPVELHLPCDREATSGEIFAHNSTPRA